MSIRKDEYENLLASSGITGPEESVLSTVSYGMVMGFESLVFNTYKCAYRKDKDSADCAIREIRQAVTSCLDKGWLKVLTAEDCRRDTEFRLNMSYPCADSFDRYVEGRIDFTSKGYELWQVIIHSTNPAGYLRIEVGLNRRVSGRIEIYAETPDACIHHRDEICEKIEFYVGFKATVITRSSPVPMGPWYASRFHLVPKGFQVVIIYYPPEDPTELYSSQK